MENFIEELEYLRAQCHVTRQFKAELLIKNRIELLQKTEVKVKKKINPTQLYLFQAMMDGKSFRLSEEGKKVWLTDNRYMSSRWFTILKFHWNGEITLCGNNHDILENASIFHLEVKPK